MEHIMPTNPTIAILGCGKMGSSLLNGLITTGFKASQLIVSDPHLSNPSPQLINSGVTFLTNNQTAIEKANTVLLAIKPQIMVEVLTPLIPAFTEHRPLIISIAAGINTSMLTTLLGSDIPCIRAMPNTPAQINQGVSALFATQMATQDHRDLADAIFAAVGQTVWIDHEALMDPITAISGSGPAYFYLIMEALIQAAIEAGIPADLAKKLVSQTAEGSIAMVKANSTSTISNLRDQVTSPGGTTAAALDVLFKHDIIELFGKAVSAATNRAVQLSTSVSGK